MKSKIILSIFIFFVITIMVLFVNCGSSEEEVVPNKAPTCAITNPANNAAIELGTTVQIAISATDVDGSVSNVKISIDDVSTTTLQSSPYTYDWNTSGVTPGQHNIKAVATDNGGLSATGQIVVTVTADAPTVTTADITEITGTTATSGGNATDDGGISITARGVVWGASSGPTLESNAGFTEDGTGTGAFTSSITNLTAATTYYVKAYATNSEGTAYGEEKSFITAGLPTVVNGEASDITHESAICAVEITNDGGTEVTARGLVWKTAGGTPPTLEDNVGFTTEGSGTGTFTSTMTSLENNTNYAVRAYATNSAGTAYGETKYFYTLEGPAAVTTLDITNIDAHIATGSGEVTDFGGSFSLDGVGIVWGTSPNPDLANNDGFYLLYPFSPDSENPFEALLSGLKPDTKYYVRAFATNDYGNVYGDEKTFTTRAFTVQTGNFTDARDNTKYSTITISGQTWMAENLAFLPEVCPSNTDCGYWVYDYQGADVSEAKATTNFTTYGVLYNWEIASTSCPTGWHLPTRDEWSIFEMNLGMPYMDAYGGSMQRGTDEGGKLKEAGTANWAAPNEGATNISKFTALPGGLRSVDKTFSEIGASAYFWTSSEYSGAADAYRKYISNNSAIIYSGAYWNIHGFSVRCLQD